MFSERIASTTPYAYAASVPVQADRAVAHIVRTVDRLAGVAIALCEARLTLDLDRPAETPTCRRCLKRANVPLAWIAKHDIFQEH